MSQSQNKQSNNDRERILNRLRSAKNINDGSISARDRSVRVFPQPENLLATFKDELSKIKGKAIEFSGSEELILVVQQMVEERQWKYLFTRDPYLFNLFNDKINTSSNEDDFEHMEAGITTCEYLISRTGSVVVSSIQPSGRLMNIFPPVHLVVAKASQLVPFIEEAIQGMKERYEGALPSQMTIITGASRTADIEKTLVMGAHGPKELIVLIDIDA
ncbi:LutC/YkgG family protein [Carboxylicivirga linearis]|uniref:Lactate utilization protein n=1 Tax=Carboxylicivirga linearis TaxID=1628157 RepID=A0ABS5JPU4_9BACT|nr:lactate utilization protein [Carboxylicivirga linearis]MBS2096885.1 lactate utilization protein [Carboxylicivirga linearis]